MHNSGLDSTAWLAAIVESSADSIISKNLDGIITSWNRGAERMFGYTADEMIGHSILKLIPSERVREEDYILGLLRTGKRLRDFETQRQCKDGRLIHVSLTISPIRNQSGEIVGVSKIARDITERKLALETQALLLKELNHRSKNLLAVADAIVRQTAKSTPATELVDRISRRLHALSINQDLMIDRDWRGAEISQIIQSQLAFILDDPAPRVQIEGQSCIVVPRVAQALGLAIYELTSNAMKYGALSVPAGRVHIKWDIQEGADGKREFSLTWRELGGPPAIRPKRKGFGSTIIESMIARSVLGTATLTYAPTGVIWELTAPESGLTGTAEPVPHAPETTPGASAVAKTG
ncbi:MAG: PAS domain S-box protein [Xanthobacteraceae bacterium]